MSRKTRIDYDRAEEDLWDQSDSEEPWGIRDYTSEREFRDYMKEHGLKPDKYIKGGSNQKNSSDDPLCFLSTACIRAKGLPDNCEELEILRAYRDGYLLQRENGKEDIEEYYSTAPMIVEAVNRGPDAQKRWTALYEDLVEPCVRLILCGENEEAYSLYKNTVTSLRREFLPEV